jgi:hypothetical protein
MKKAWTEPINIVNTEAFVEMWKRYQQHMVFPLDTVVACVLSEIPPRKASSQDKLIELYIPLEERQKRSTNSVHGILIFGNSTGLLNSCLWDKSLEKLSQIIKASSATPCEF